MGGPEVVPPLGPKVIEALQKIEKEAREKDTLLGIKREELRPLSHQIIEDLDGQH